VRPYSWQQGKNKEMRWLSRIGGLRPRLDHKGESILFADFQKSAVKMDGTDTRYGSLVRFDGGRDMQYSVKTGTKQITGKKKQKHFSP
jgi:hypothetical protein